MTFRQSIWIAGASLAFSLSGCTAFAGSAQEAYETDPVDRNAAAASSFRRTTIRVANAEQSLAFYRDLVGLSLISRMDLSSEKTRRSLAIEDDTVGVELLSLSGPPGQALGLLAVSGQGETLARSDGRDLAAGDVILVFEVDDVQSIAARAPTFGAPIISPVEPLTSRAGYELILRDPDGVRVQLLQFGPSSDGASASE